jgi:hypothetical protein
MGELAFYAALTVLVGAGMLGAAALLGLLMDDFRGR